MSKPNQTIGQLISLAKSAPHNLDRRAKFKSAARAFYKAILNEMGRKEPVLYSNRYNPGGIAGSGDAILHTFDFYIYINNFGCYWRKVKSLSDYCGDYNRTGKDDWTPREFAEQIALAIHPQFAVA